MADKQGDRVTKNDINKARLQADFVTPPVTCAKFPARALGFLHGFLDSEERRK